MDAPPSPPAHQDCVCGWAERDGRVLLVRNRRLLHGVLTLCWDLPGGRVEPGESLPAALAREWREETHLEATVGDLLLVEDGVVRAAPEAPVARTWRTTYFAVTSQGEPVPDDGVVEAAWFPRDDIEGLLQAPYHAAMRAYLRGCSDRHAHVTWINRPSPQPSGSHGDLTALLAMAAAGAQGELLVVPRHAAAAREGGASDVRIAEALLQLAPYCGFPRTLGALSAVAPIWPDGAPTFEADVDPAERPARGRSCFDAVYGSGADRIRESLTALHPLVGAWIESFAYGRVLAREGALTLCERELLAVSILTAMGGLDEPLLGHMRAAKRLGASVEQIHAAAYAVPFELNDTREVSARVLLENL